MSPDELRERFLGEIDRRGTDDRYIDGIEERELLQIAVQHGYAADAARALLTDACRARGYVVEAAVVALVRERLRLLQGRINQAAFEHIVGDAALATRTTTRTDRDVRRLVLTTMGDDGNLSVKRGLFRDWYARQRREAGLPK